MFEVKLNEAMEAVFREIHDASSIDNKLTGFVRTAHEEQDPEYRASLDQGVKRMSVAGETPAKTPTGGRVPHALGDLARQHPRDPGRRPLRGGRRGEQVQGHDQGHLHPGGGAGPVAPGN